MKWWSRWKEREAVLTFLFFLGEKQSAGAWALELGRCGQRSNDR